MKLSNWFRRRVESVEFKPEDAAFLTVYTRPDVEVIAPEGWVLKSSSPGVAMFVRDGAEQQAGAPLRRLADPKFDEASYNTGYVDGERNRSADYVAALDEMVPDGVDAGNPDQLRHWIESSRS